MWKSGRPHCCCWWGELGCTTTVPTPPPLVHYTRLDTLCHRYLHFSVLHSSWVYPYSRGRHVFFGHRFPYFLDSTIFLCTVIHTRSLHTLPSLLPLIVPQTPLSLDKICHRDYPTHSIHTFSPFPAAIFDFIDHLWSRVVLPSLSHQLYTTDLHYERLDKEDWLVKNTACCFAIALRGGGRPNKNQLGCGGYRTHAAGVAFQHADHDNAVTRFSICFSGAYGINLK